ncbi:alr1852 [Nostoc sp. PCC 7120 = FACHB-418]|nr:alr1852 [Nostoc sp. PCC 7120 = FACHB-418]
MEMEQEREQDLKKHIEEDRKLQKKLEDQYRYTENEKEKIKLEKDIKEIRQRISGWEEEISTISMQRRESIAREMPSITFDELDVVTKFILGMQPASPEINFSLTDITQKISKNHLTQEVHSLITMGMGKVKDVGRFIEHNAVLRPEFPDKLTAGFLTEYQKLLQKGITGDALFESLRQFSCGNSSDFRKAAAGLAVLSYLFEKCEVFER